LATAGAIAVQGSRSLFRIILVLILAGLALHQQPLAAASDASFMEQAAAEPRTEASKEYAVKAAFIYKFISYTAWPKEGLPPKSKPIVVAIIGPNPFGKILADLLKSKKIHERTLEVKHFEKMPASLNAQIIVCADSSLDFRASVIKKYKNKPTLVIGEHKGFVKAGAHIGFYLEKGKIRFEVNLSSLKSSKLKMSSQLLKLARVIKG
jgi:hypothetical protein